jgi:hypothetical protein
MKTVILDSGVGEAVAEASPLEVRVCPRSDRRVARDIVKRIAGFYKEATYRPRALLEIPRKRRRG